MRTHARNNQRHTLVLKLRVRPLCHCSYVLKQACLYSIGALKFEPSLSGSDARALQVMSL